MIQIDRNLISLTDEQIEQLFEDYARIILAADGDVIYGPASEIEVFRSARKSWARPGVVDHDDDEALVISDCAAVKGQPKRDVVLIRIGDYVAIHGMDQ